MPKHDLKYWKGRKIDADAAVRQAQAHWLDMLNYDVEADEKIEEIEQKILVHG